MPFELTLHDCRIAMVGPELDVFITFLENHRKRYSKAVLISDTQVYPLYGEQILRVIRESGLSIEPIVIQAGESYKNLSTAEYCWIQMQAMGIDRESLVVGLGGGVITDISGFVAASYMRGIANVQIPTSLMGMVDATIGGKTAVNLPAGKNLIGAFHQPKLVLIAPHYLATLPVRELHSGVAEVIKSAVIWDAPFFEYLERHLQIILRASTSQMGYLIEKATAIKAEIVSQDEKESGLRALLNWGHTFGHALETLTHYQTFLHGEAVAIGMVCAAHVSFEMGLVERAFIDRLESLCMLAQLPIRLPANIDKDAMINQMAADKKTVSGKLTLILARGVGTLEIFNDVDRGIVKKALLHMR